MIIHAGIVALYLGADVVCQQGARFPKSPHKSPGTGGNEVSQVWICLHPSHTQLHCVNGFANKLVCAMYGVHFTGDGT